MADTNLSKVIQTALENIKKIADANTIIGEAIKVSDEITIIPVSKVSMGFTSGGVDYKSKRAPESSPNFGGVSGAGVSVSPLGFIVIDGSGKVSMMSMESGDSGGIVGTIADIAEKAPEIISNITKIFKKKAEDKEEDPS